MLATRGVGTFELPAREALEVDCGAAPAAGVLKVPFVEVGGAGVLIAAACSAPEGAEA